MKRWIAALCAAVLVLVPGCARDPQQTLPEQTEPEQMTLAAPSLPENSHTQPLPTQTLDAEAVMQEAQVLSENQPMPPQQATVEAPGTLVKSGDGAMIDYSNTSQGYVMVRYDEPTEQRLKVQVKGPSTTYTYNLTPGQWTAFPLSDGNGAYQIVVYINVTGTKYASVLSLTEQVTLVDEFAPFLHSNQYVDYDAAPSTVEKAWELTKGIEEPLEQVAAVYDFVVGNISYDKELAAAVKSGYLPELDRVLERRTGICFDYAALMTGMLRSRGIPTKLVVGYAGDIYHAWISVWTERSGWVDGVIFFDGTTWKRMDPTFASSGGGSEEIMAYIGNSDNYTVKYVY